MTSRLYHECLGCTQPTCVGCDIYESIMPTNASDVIKQCAVHYLKNNELLKARQCIELLVDFTSGKIKL